MKFFISDSAYDDLRETAHFYEAQEAGMSERFVRFIWNELEQILDCAGTHRRAGKYHRVLVQKYHIGIFYLIHDDTVDIRRVIDLRRDPRWIRRELKRSL